VKAKTAAFQGANIRVGLLGLLAMLLVGSVYTGVKLPFISNERMALVAPVVIGFTMCSLEMGRHIESLGWTHWVNIAGMILGAWVVLLFALVLMGVKAPLLSGERAAILAVSVIGLAKVVLARLPKLTS
jgi:hypothetical protein